MSVVGLGPAGRAAAHTVRQEGMAVNPSLGRLILGAAIVCTAAAACGASTVEPESVLDAIIWIEHQSGLVKSAQGSFTVRYLPTSPEEMERIAAWCRHRDNAYRDRGYYVSPRQASRRSYYATWWRKGNKERQEKTHIARPAIVETTVFDGESVLTLDGTPGRSCLYIASPLTHWWHKVRIQPLALAFEYRSDSHGALLRESPQRRVDRHRVDDEGRTMVTARHPADERLTLRWVYDDQRRLLVRDAILTRPSPFIELDNDQPALYSRWEFSGFRPYADGQGNRFWFPSGAMLRYYLGTLPDGSPVQSHAMRIEVGEIEFNADIPDEKFELESPEGVPVRDLRDSRYSVIGVSY
jgi:outer membrane lipoprotein-sorting protein